MKTTTAIRWAVAAATIVSAGAASAQISLYEYDGFGGRSYSSNNSVSNLADNGFNDRASSVIVRGGRWQVCSDAYFGGRCETLGPGEYPSLQPMGLSNKISSVRSLGWTPDGGGGWGNNPPPQWGGGNASSGGNWGSGARAVLYSGYNLSGE